MASICTAARARDEVLLSAHICHPSLANDNCSGLALLTHLAARLAAAEDPLQLPLPVRAGHDRRDRLARPQRAQGGTHPARPRPVLRRRRRRPDLQAKPPRRRLDRPRHGACPRSTPGRRRRILDFFPYGYDERQYLLAGLQPAGRPVPAQPVRHLSRISHLGRQSRLHPAASISPRPIGMIAAADRHRRARLARRVNTSPKCEPQLGRRGLYGALGGDRDGGGEEHGAALWILNLADGRHSLLDIAERAKLPFGWSPMPPACSRRTACSSPTAVMFDQWLLVKALPSTEIGLEIPLALLATSFARLVVVATAGVGRLQAAGRTPGRKDDAVRRTFSSVSGDGLRQPRAAAGSSPGRTGVRNAWTRSHTAFSSFSTHYRGAFPCASKRPTSAAPG